MDAFDAIGLLLPALEKVGDRIIGYDEKIRKKFNRALQTALKANDELYIEKAGIHMAELVGLIVLVMDEPSSINTIPLPNYINRDEFRSFYEETKRDKDLSQVLNEERKQYKIKEANDTLKAIDERVKELSNSVEKITNKIESNERINKGFTHQSTTLDSGNSSPFATEYFARDLLNGDIESFLNRMKSFFANYSYELIRDLENHYQNVMYTFCSLLGLYTKAEYHTSKGRIDMVVKTQQFIYVFEFKFNKSAEEALEQIDRKEYLAPFRMDGRKLYKVGINFSNENNNIERWRWEVEQSPYEAVNHANGNNNKDSIADSVSPLVKCLNKKLKQKRDNHPSFKLMKIEDDLFPDGMITFEFETEALDSDNKPKRVKDIVEESWNKPDRNHLMIEGIGGIGKTVTLLSLPDKFAPHYVPAVYIPLHELQGETSTIEKYIKGQVLDYNDREVRYGELMDVVEEPWDKGPRLLLLLDGFNEIANERRVDISRDIEHWSERPGVQIITSSRYDIRQYVALGSNYSKIELQSLTPEKVTEYLHRIGYDVPANQAVMDLISTPLLLTLYIKTEKARICRQSPLADFRETKNAGSLIWNYLQSELWRFRGNQEETKACVLAMEFIAPHIAWNMLPHNDFVLKEDVFLGWTEAAYKLLEEHFGNAAELPRHIKNTVRLTSRHLPEYELIRDLLKEQLSMFNKQEREDENKERIVEYRLMHQQFRDALAALHLINLSYLSGCSLYKEWETPIDHYVMRFVADLINEEEATKLWEQNRKTTPAIDDATRNQLRLQGLRHNNDFTHLDFSGLDLSNVSLYPYRNNLATIKLPTQPEKLSKTRLSNKTFSPEGHDGPVSAITVTADGKRIISGSHDRTIRIWDLETGAQIGKPIKVFTDIKSIIISLDGKHIVSKHRNNAIYIMDLETGTQAEPFNERPDIENVMITPECKCIVSRRRNKALCIWDLQTGKREKTIKKPKNFGFPMAISPNGKHIITRSSYNTIRVWNLETGSLIGKPIKCQNLSTIVVTPNGKRIISGLYDNSIRIWDLETGSPIGKPLVGHKDYIITLAVTPDSKHVVSGSEDNTVRVWDIERCSPMGNPMEEHTNPVCAVAITPDGKRIISGSYDNSIRIWDLETCSPIGNPIEGNKVSVLSVAVTPDNKQILTGSLDNIIRKWSIETCHQIENPIIGHTKPVQAIAITPDSTRIISGSTDNTIRIWDLKTGTQIGKPIFNGPVGSIAVTPDSTNIISGSADGALSLWNLKTRKLTMKFPERHYQIVTSIAITPDCKHVISGSYDSSIRIWDLKSGNLRGWLNMGESYPIHSIAVDIESKRLYSGTGDGTIRVWDIKHNYQIKRIIIGKKCDSVKSIALIPNSNRIVSASLGTIQIWDLNTWTQTGKPIEEHGSTVNAVVVTLNGNYIVSGASNGTICITDLKTLKVRTICILPLSLVGLDFSKADISDAELKETLRQNGAKV